MIGLGFQALTKSRTRVTSRGTISCLQTKEKMRIVVKGKMKMKMRALIKVKETMQTFQSGPAPTATPGEAQFTMVAMNRCKKMFYTIGTTWLRNVT